MIQALGRVGEALWSYNRLRRAGRTSAPSSAPGPVSCEPSSPPTNAQEALEAAAVSPPLPSCPVIQEGTTITSYTDTYTDTYNASYTSSYQNNNYEVLTEVNDNESSPTPEPASPRSTGEDLPSDQVTVGVTLPGPDSPLTIEFLLGADGTIQVINEGQLRPLRRTVTFGVQKEPSESSKGATDQAPEAAVISFTLPALTAKRNPTS
ncbi:hypothetical protein ACP26L_17385 [Paenibacillus sp. S-38]|uniref:hypothetical protein n=1 Tax=Paenibacillus sp. S-38 TaxID=3416710 RepID=UPI003CEBA86A